MIRNFHLLFICAALFMTFVGQRALADTWGAEKPSADPVKKKKKKKKYTSATDTSANWRDVYGSADRQCAPGCDLGMMLQTVECGGVAFGLIDLRAANASFCSNQPMSPINVSIIEQNADNISRCLRLHPNKDQYHIFMHEMLCKWSECRKNPPPYKPPSERTGIWTEEASGIIHMTLRNYKSQLNGITTVEYTGHINEFGAELTARGLGLCDIARSESSAPPPVPVIVHGVTDVAAPEPVPAPSERTIKNRSSGTVH